MTPVADEPLPFWFEDGRPGARAADLDLAETYTGHRLPAALRKLLLVKNGGVSNYSAYQSGNRYYPLLPVFGVDPAAAAGSLMRAFDVRRSFGVPDGVVPFAGQGHAWWGLDYRADPSTPCVVFRQDEEHEVELVASCFEDLLKGLVEE